MIRRFETADIERVMEIWIDSNLDAHSFIPEDYWQTHFAGAKEAIAAAEVYVYEIDGAIAAFMGIKNRHIEGIFVDSKYRSGGIGKELLDYAKALYNKLTLSVYKRNARAAEFYLREGFAADREQMDLDTCETEIFMKWENGEAKNEKLNSYRNIFSS